MTYPSLPLPELISQSSTRKRKQRTLMAQYGDGYDQTVGDGANAFQDEWNISYDNLEEEDYETLLEFFNEVGSTGRWTWTPHLDSTEKTWKIVIDSWTESFPSGNITNIKFQARQVA